LEGEYAVVHDQMIEHGDLDEGEGGSDPVRDLEVCVRRLRVSGRMIVIEHHADGVMVKDRSHHFAGVHAAPVEGAAKEVGMAISRCAVLRCRRPSARRGLSHTAAAYIRTSPVMRKPDLLSMTGGGMAAGGNRASFPVSTSDAMQGTLTESEAYAEGGGVLANRLSTRGAMAREVVRE